MTTARIRSALAPVLKTLGFARRGSEFVFRQLELEHAISVFSVRRLTGYFEVVHRVLEVTDDSPRATGHVPLIQARIQGFMEPYLGLWASDKFDTALAAKQIAAVVSAFSSLEDVTHFYSDRPRAHGIPTLKALAPVGVPNSFSVAEEERQLRHHSHAVLANQFTPVPRLGKEMWVHRQEVGGYRYCAYLAATDTATFATLLYFPFASIDIEKGRKNDGVLRLLFGTPKRLLADGGQPVLIPLGADAFDHERVSEVLLRLLAERPPNSLPLSDV